MTPFREKDGILNAENVPLTTIAHDVATPTYIYSTAHIRHQFETLRDAMKRAIPADRQPLLCYACKANSHIAVLSLLRSMGSGLEIVSEGELMRGLKAGFSPKHIVSTGVGKNRGEIAALLKAGAHQINVESLPELEQIQSVASEINIPATIVFRLNPNIGGGSHDKNTTGRAHDKFGISAKKIFDGYAMARNMSHVNAVGLSVHIGSQVSDVATFKIAFETFPNLVTDLRAAGFEVSRLDIGGGFPIQYEEEGLLNLDAYAQWVNDIIVPLDTEIIMEPGRYLVGNSGVLLTRVEFVKQAEARNFLIVDAGMSDLIRPTLYDAYHAIESVQNRDASTVKYDVVGPICESGDTFAMQRSITHMSKGDLAVIKSVGAYGYCMASNYNTRGRPAEVLVDGDRYTIITQRESAQDVIDRDIVPEWMN